MTDQKRILVVDDEPRYIRALQVTLEASGYQVLAATDGQTAIHLAAAEAPDLVLLDLRLPDMDGCEVCRRVREFSTVPIIMVTALADNLNKVQGLDLGADDYVTKPFNADELLARIRAVLRRAALPPQYESASGFQAAGLRVDFAGQRVFVEDQEVQLTAIEYHLLHTLVRQVGRILTPAFLLEAVWGEGYEGDDHLVWQAVHRLRRKIEPDPEQPRYLHTRPGLGYLFDPQE